MNRSLFWIITLSMFALLNSTCNDKDDECMCKDNEECIYDAFSGQDECYLSESVHLIGGIRVIAPNSYVGIVNGNQCVDSLIFYNDTTRALDDERFGLIVDSHSGVQNVMGSDIPFQAGSNEFYSSSVLPLCYVNDDGWYSNLHFIIYPDSVWMQLKFWTLESQPGVFIDSTTLIFYKKH